MNRGNGRRTVFHKEGDFDAFRRLLGEAAARADMRLLAYCLMPNHFHLALWPRRDGDLSDYMMWLADSPCPPLYPFPGAIPGVIISWHGYGSNGPICVK